MTAYVIADVADTIVEAEYQGSVYERTIVISLDSEDIHVFDGKNIISESDRGSSVKLTLKAHLVGDFIVETDEKLGLNQRPDRDSEWSARIVGRVVSTDRSPANRTLRLDIGSGEMLLELDDPPVAEMDFDTGDTIRAECGRVDIIGRE